MRWFSDSETILGRQFSDFAALQTMREFPYHICAILGVPQKDMAECFRIVDRLYLRPHISRLRYVCQSKLVSSRSASAADSEYRKSDDDCSHTAATLVYTKAFVRESIYEAKQYLAVYLASSGVVLRHVSSSWQSL
jgi:hypothetical protein